MLILSYGVIDSDAFDKHDRKLPISERELLTFHADKLRGFVCPNCHESGGLYASQLWWFNCYNCWGCGFDMEELQNGYCKEA